MSFDFKLFLRKKSKFFVFILVFFVIAIPSTYIPIHSDDYFYFFKGVSFSSIYAHYIGWSGRAVADSISSFLLFFFPKNIYALINAFAFSLLIYFISILPKFALRSKSNNNVFVFVLVFLLYWIANPNLGQTSFWVVGSANYLWTNLILVGYFLLLFFLKSKKKMEVNFLVLPVVFLLSVLAGWTNENTGLFAFVVSFFLLVEAYLNNKFIFIRSNLCYVVGVIGSLVGYAFLLFAPGNMIRAKQYDYWYSQPKLQRIESYMMEAFPWEMKAYWQVYIVLLFCLFMLALIKRDDENVKKVITYSLLFFVVAILADLALVESPVLPPRALNGALIFLLISTSFIFYYIIDSMTTMKSKILFFMVPLFFCLIYFIPSYFLFVSAMKSTQKQEGIRNKIIFDAKSKGDLDIKIPDFYFTKLVKYEDQFDTYHNPQTMGKFWGVNSIDKYDVNFDYSVISDKENSILIGKDIVNGFHLINVYLYDEVVGVFNKRKNYILFEFDKNPELYINNDNGMFFSICNAGGFCANVDVSNVKPNLIAGKYYISSSVAEVIESKNVKKVQFGMHNIKTGIRLSEQYLMIK